LRDRVDEHDARHAARVTTQRVRVRLVDRAAVLRLEPHRALLHTLARARVTLRELVEPAAKRHLVELVHAALVLGARVVIVAGGGGGAATRRPAVHATKVLAREAHAVAPSLFQFQTIVRFCTTGKGGAGDGWMNLWDGGRRRNPEQLRFFWKRSSNNFVTLINPLRDDVVLV